MQSLGNASQQGPASGLVDVLFGQRPPRFMANLPPWTPINSGTHLKASFAPQMPGHKVDDGLPRIQADLKEGNTTHQLLRVGLYCM